MIFISLDHGNWCLNQEEKANNFSNFCFQIIYRYLKRWQKMAYLGDTNCKLNTVTPKLYCNVLMFQYWCLITYIHSALVTARLLYKLKQNIIL